MLTELLRAESCAFEMAVGVLSDFGDNELIKKTTKAQKKK